MIAAEAVLSTEIWKVFPLLAITKFELAFTAVAAPPSHAASVYLTLYLALSEEAPPDDEENFKWLSSAVVIVVTFTEAEVYDELDTIW